MSVTPQTPFYKGILLIGSLQIPCYPNPSFTCPRNVDAPPIIGNYWQFNYADGLQQPYVDINIAVRDKTGEALSAAFLSLFHTRSSDVAHDTGVISGGIKFWDGRSGFTMAGAKADSYTIHVAKPELIQMTARFCGTLPTALGSAPSFSAWDNSKMLRGTKAQVADMNVWSVDLSYSNNHNPDMSLDLTNGPAACNAGMMTAGLSTSVQAADTVLADSEPIEITIVGTAGAITFTVNNPVDNARDNRMINAPRVMRPHQYVSLGGDGQTTPPISISTTY